MNANKPVLIVLMGASLVFGEGSIRGVVVDQTDARIAGASVTLRGSGIEKHEQSGVEGEFAFAEVPPGTYSLEISNGGFKTTSWKATQVSSTALDLGHLMLPLGHIEPCKDFVPNVDVAPGAQEIRGYIEDGRGVAFREVTVTIRSVQRGSRAFTVHADRRGRFIFPDVPVGTYKLRAHAPGRSDFVMDEVIVRAQHTSEIAPGLQLLACPSAGPCPIATKYHTDICL